MAAITGMGIEQSRVNRQDLPPEMAQEKSSHVEWVNDQMTILAEAFQATWTAQTQAVYVEALIDLNKTQLQQAISRAVRELKFFPKVAEIRELAGAGREQLHDAEAHKAWDMLLNYVDTWIHADPQGSYGPEQGCRMYPPPKLAPRIADCARRLGGWRRLKTASEDDVPFLKKDFIEEYKRWEEVERIDLSHMLTAAAPKLQLKAMDPEPPVLTSVLHKLVRNFGESNVAAAKPKPVPEPLTPAQVRDRREMLRQQVEHIRAKSANVSSEGRDVQRD